METKTDILNELDAISPLIAGIKKVNVFTVPNEYFETISDTVMVCLREEGFAFTTSNARSATEVPIGYFDELAASILGKIKANDAASEEIKYLSPLLFDLQKKQVFKAPKDYFQNLPERIVEKIDTLTEVNSSIEEISPLLQDLKDKNIFELPEGYFFGLADTIIKKVQQPSAGKVISINKNSSWIKYAVAAMMTGIVALGLYKYIDKTGSGVVDLTPTAVATLDASIKKGTSMNEQQFNEALGNLSETAIAKYLEKNGDITDVALLGNNLKESNLPNEEDYLLDESTLDNYLKDIETNTLKN